jgi:hypothetical protein
MRRHLCETCCTSVLFLMATLAGAQDGKKTPNYFPLDEGNEWLYRVTENGAKSKLIMRIGKLEDKFKGLARLESPDVNRSEHLTQTDKGIFRHRADGDAVTPPFCLLPYPPKPGTKWADTFTVGKIQAKYAGEIFKEEAIDVPFAKMKKLTALRAVITLEEKGKTIETTYWFVQDVGIVKQSFEIAGRSVLLELEKFDKKK